MLSLSALRSSDAAVLTASEVAGLFGVDARTISAAVAAGDLPFVRIGRRLFIPREPLLAMLTVAPMNERRTPASGNG